MFNINGLRNESLKFKISDKYNKKVKEKNFLMKQK